MAAQKPNAVPSVVTSIDSTTGGVTITWGSPSANGGPISSYTIEINTYSTSLWPPSSSCDGSSSTVKAAMSCTIPMSEIIGAYAYTFDSLVLVRVSSTNEYGTSTTTTNFGNARARRIPSTMNAPVIASSSDTSIVITWTELSGTTAGNSAILSYTIYWNKGTDATASTVVTEALFASPTYTFSSLTGGATYRFAIRG